MKILCITRNDRWVERDAVHHAVKMKSHFPDISYADKIFNYSLAVPQAISSESALSTFSVSVIQIPHCPKLRHKTTLIESDGWGKR